MGLRFTVLASGSAGNASLLEAPGVSTLVDVGLGPRQLAARLAKMGASWQQVGAVLLTHTHSDHWRERTLACLGRHHIPLYCHPEHAAQLTHWSAAFTDLHAAGLVRTYEGGQEVRLAADLVCRPLPVRHDGGQTFGFRFEAAGEAQQPPPTLAYAADLGSWTAELAQHLADVDLLALEFNHDVAMEYASGRSPYLIARVLGEEGHLSNEQAAGLLREVVRRSAPGRLRHLVQLHLSRDCNRPNLAQGAARRVLQKLGCHAQVCTASQDEPGPTLQVGGLNGHEPRSKPAGRQPHGTASRRVSSLQRWLPGLED